MTSLQSFVATQPGWAWVGVAAAFLAAETATGSGYLLWPSASGAMVGVLLLLGVPLPLPLQAFLFAALTLGLTLAARRWLPRRGRDAGRGDLNDAAERLLGQEGETVSASPPRVFVDGKEWAAEFDGPQAAPGGRVHVLAVLGGARLKVRAG